MVKIEYHKHPKPIDVLFRYLYQKFIQQYLILLLFNLIIQIFIHWIEKICNKYIE